MTDRKYAKYFQTDIKLPEGQHGEAAEYIKDVSRIRMTYLDDSVVQGAFYVVCTWWTGLSSGESLPPHIHDVDEVLGFYGSDIQNPRNLGGEIEFWLEEEKYVLDTSFLVFIPKGMKHCPLKLLSIERPIFHVGVMLNGQYSKEEKV